MFSGHWSTCDAGEKKLQLVKFNRRRLKTFFEGKLILTFSCKLSRSFGKVISFRIRISMFFGEWEVKILCSKWRGKFRTVASFSSPRATENPRRFSSSAKHFFIFFERFSRVPLKQSKALWWCLIKLEAAATHKPARQLFHYRFIARLIEAWVQVDVNLSSYHFQSLEDFWNTQRREASRGEANRDENFYHHHSYHYILHFSWCWNNKETDKRNEDKYYHCKRAEKGETKIEVKT